MHVVVAVAIHTLGWGSRIRIAGRVTVPTTCKQVRACQHEICPAMFEQARVYCHDVRVPAFMVCVAHDALVLTRGIESAMKARHSGTVGPDVLMTTCAQLGRGPVGSTVVARSAVVLDIGVTLDNSPWHQQPFESRSRGKATCAREQQRGPE